MKRILLTCGAITFLASGVQAQNQNPLMQRIENSPTAVQSQSFAIRPTVTATTPAFVPVPAAAPVTASTPASATAGAAGPVYAEAQPVNNGAAPQAAVVRNQEAPAVASTTFVAREEIGDVTRMLLAAQARSERSGTEHTVLGVTATHTWERYIQSFTHPIPQTFETLDTQRSSN